MASECFLPPNAALERTLLHQSSDNISASVCERKSESVFLFRWIYIFLMVRCILCLLRKHRKLDDRYRAQCVLRAGKLIPILMHLMARKLIGDDDSQLLIVRHGPSPKATACMCFRRCAREVGAETVSRSFSFGWLHLMNEMFVFENEIASLDRPQRFWIMNSSAVQHLWWPADEKITRPAESDSSSKNMVSGTRHYWIHSGEWYENRRLWTTILAIKWNHQILGYNASSSN